MVSAYAARMPSARFDWWDEWGGGVSVTFFALAVGALVLLVGPVYALPLSMGLWFWWQEYRRAPVIAVVGFVVLTVASAVAGAAA